MKTKTPKEINEENVEFWKKREGKLQQYGETYPRAFIGVVENAEKLIKKGLVSDEDFVDQTSLDAAIELPQHNTYIEVVSKAGKKGAEFSAKAKQEKNANRNLRIQNDYDRLSKDPTKGSREIPSILAKTHNLSARQIRNILKSKKVEI